MEYKSYVVTCLGCKNNSRMKISNTNQVMYIDHTPIIAARFRPDMTWGFECTCGNDSRLAAEEIPQVDMLVSGASESVVERIVKMAKLKPEKLFRMAVV